MGQVSAVLRAVTNGYAHFCPACERMHVIRTRATEGPIWAISGSFERPTFNPSVRITYNGPDAGAARQGSERAPAACCHYFVRDGQIEFCGDCTHAMAGKTIELPPIPERLRDWR